MRKLLTQSQQARAMKARLLSPDGETTSDTGTKRARAALIMKGIAGAIAVGSVVYAFMIRPWHLRWGATEEEATTALPGDELLKKVQMQSTRGITIEAPASRIWPWLVQMGQGRGGLYSYDWLENLAGCDIHSADRIIPDLQSLSIGDTFRLGPERYPSFTVASVMPERELVLAAGLELCDRSLPESLPGATEEPSGATWAFVLRPLDENRTRLLIRLRGNWEKIAGMTAFNRIFLEPAHFIMERKMIYGIKERAEQAAAEES